MDDKTLVRLELTKSLLKNTGVMAVRPQYRDRIKAAVSEFEKFVLQSGEDGKSEPKRGPGRPPKEPVADKKETSPLD